MSQPDQHSSREPDDQASDGGSLHDPVPVDPAPVELGDALVILADGEMEIEGRMPWSSNATFLVKLHHDRGMVKAIYKPAAGERPLWDFPEGLFRREVAAYELSLALGWDMVPPTIGRDGEYGRGSVQLFIAADFEQHHFTLVEHPQHHPQLRRMCAFDLLANNTDRKSGHCLLDKDGHIWGIDHGLCFAVEFKLRTVIWEFADEQIGEELMASIQNLAEEGVPENMLEHLARDEAAALWHRALDLAESGQFPRDESGRRYPWPLV